MNATDENGAIRHTSQNFRLLVARDYAEWARDERLTDATGFEASITRARSVPGGRSPNMLLESKGDPIRLRPCQHGGFLAGLLGDRFLSPERPFREFRIWAELRRRGVPLPTPILAASRRHGFLWRSVFGSLECVGAQDAAAWLATRPNPEQLRRACIAFASSLRRLHDAGGLHGDLQLRNVLVKVQEDEKASTRLIWVDLDRARIVERASPDQRLRELMRFARSLEKAGRPDLISRRFRAISLSAYCAGDRTLRRSMLRWGPMEARRIRRHRLGWWLKRRISGALLYAIVALALSSGNVHSDPTESARWARFATGDTGRTSAPAGMFEGPLSVAREMTGAARINPVDFPPTSR